MAAAFTILISPWGKNLTYSYRFGVLKRDAWAGEAPEIFHSSDFAEYEIITHDKRKLAGRTVGGVALGGFLFGPLGALAGGLMAGNKNLYLLALKLCDGTEILATASPDVFTKCIAQGAYTKPEEFLPEEEPLEEATSLQEEASQPPLGNPENLVQQDSVIEKKKDDTLSVIGEVKRNDISQQETGPSETSAETSTYRPLIADRIKQKEEKREPARIWSWLAAFFVTFISVIFAAVHPLAGVVSLVIAFLLAKKANQGRSWARFAPILWWIFTAIWAVGIYGVATNQKPTEEKSSAENTADQASAPMEQKSNEPATNETSKKPAVVAKVQNKPSWKALPIKDAKSDYYLDTANMIKANNVATVRMLVSNKKGVEDEEGVLSAVTEIRITCKAKTYDNETLSMSFFDRRMGQGKEDYSKLDPVKNKFTDFSYKGNTPIDVLARTVCTPK